MHAIATTDHDEFTLPGIRHRTAASHADGLAALEVWRQTLAPGASTPVHSHACEEVVMVLAGSGVVIEEGRSTRFSAGTTLVIPPGVVHRIVNDGTETVDTVAAFSESPARAFGVDGVRLALPWECDDQSALMADVASREPRNA